MTAQALAPPVALCLPLLTKYMRTYGLLKTDKDITQPLPHA